ncbi:hypothetical protein ABZ816_17835 [Actinosynnema sp. NPDC047251]|uniref:Uncharacterized protein n=1 Tax=Saccharothrix espanaensis (strain ATCC 51144 / DSM 44229 / JCM 9112 / NBRC 15066 / NRRL 15764) TaxID=1179773 RepID=K0JZZ8_SACES|nr:hypothetical protein [Saccharothrix espanaensis]CCH30244.1 hypothetical protein BN6_29340 [Saccharothrix espanaensis DSM 44229]
MGKKRSGGVGDNFHPVTFQAFGFLVDEWGLTGPRYDPEDETSTVTYGDDPVGYLVVLDRLEHRIAVVAIVGRLSAEVAALVPAAGLGPPQAVRSSANTVRGLEQSLESQAAMVRRLHPRLAGPEGVGLLRAANG